MLFLRISVHDEHHNTSIVPDSEIVFDLSPTTKVEPNVWNRSEFLE